MSDFRKRVLEPALIPLGAFAFIGALAYAVSRILLAVTTEGSVLVAMLLAACILFAAAAVAKGGVMKSVQKVSLIAFSLLLLGGGIAVEASLGPREVEKHLEVAATLVAQGLKFDVTEFTVPADEQFLLALDNRDPDPHNVSIYVQRGGDQLFTFPPFTGPAKREFPSDPDGIPTGVYYFQCDVHPAMNGTARAGEGGGGPQAGGTTPATPAPAPTSPLPSPSPGAATPSQPIPLVAKNTAFDKTELTFPAGSQVVIDFSNQDSLPHNWSLYSDTSGTSLIFGGEIFMGPAERKYTFSAPTAPGEYFFRCDVHPLQMSGTATVT